MTSTPANPPPRHVAARGATFGNDLPLVLIAGPCQLETLDHALSIAEPLAAACDRSGGISWRGSRGGMSSSMRRSLAVRADRRAPSTGLCTAPAQTDNIALAWGDTAGRVDQMRGPLVRLSTSAEDGHRHFGD